MTIITDKVNVPDGTDFTFVCKKIPFAISCLSEIPYRNANLVDLDLVNKMGIPLRNIKVTRMSLLGHDVRAVGHIKQTIQCVIKGKVQGTIHLEAKVVRDLYTILGADCIASARTYSRLMDKKPPDPPDDDPEEEDNKKPNIHLGGDDIDDVVKNDTMDKQEDQGDKTINDDDNKEEKEDNMKAPFCDEDQPNHNQTTTRPLETSNASMRYAHHMWELVPDYVKGIEISAYRNGHDVSSEMAIHHAIAEHKYLMELWEEDYWDIEDFYEEPPKPVDHSPNAKKFCQTCYEIEAPESDRQSHNHGHHTGQMFTCPYISSSFKRNIAKSF